MASMVVPERTAIAIHYPGYVENTQAALDTMGGLACITNSHTAIDKDAMQVLCRPGCAAPPSPCDRTPQSPRPCCKSPEQLRMCP